MFVFFFEQYLKNKKSYCSEKQNKNIKFFFFISSWVSSVSCV